MDKKQLDQAREIFETKVIEEVDNLQSKTTRGLSFKYPQRSSEIIQTAEISILHKIQDQRHQQRKTIFRFSISLIIVLLLITFILVGLQIGLRLTTRSEVKLFEGYQLELIVSGMFISIIGIINIIAKSLWDDKPYIESLREENKLSK